MPRPKNVVEVSCVVPTTWQDISFPLNSGTSLDIIPPGHDITSFRLDHVPESLEAVRFQSELLKYEFRGRDMVGPVDIRAMRQREIAPRTAIAAPGPVAVHMWLNSKGTFYIMNFKCLFRPTTTARPTPTRLVITFEITAAPSEDYKDPSSCVRVPFWSYITTNPAECNEEFIRRHRLHPADGTPLEDAMRTGGSSC